MKGLKQMMALSPQRLREQTLSKLSRVQGRDGRSAAGDADEEQAEELLLSVPFADTLGTLAYSSSSNDSGDSKSDSKVRWPVVKEPQQQQRQQQQQQQQQRSESSPFRDLGERELRRRCWELGVSQAGQKEELVGRLEEVARRVAELRLGQSDVMPAGAPAAGDGFSPTRMVRANSTPWSPRSVRKEKENSSFGGNNSIVGGNAVGWLGSKPVPAPAASATAAADGAPAAEPAAAAQDGAISKKRDEASPTSGGAAPRRMTRRNRRSFSDGQRQRQGRSRILPEIEVRFEQVLVRAPLSSTSGTPSPSKAQQPPHQHKQQQHKQRQNNRPQHKHEDPRAAVSPAKRSPALHSPALHAPATPSPLKYKQPNPFGFAGSPVSVGAMLPHTPGSVASTSSSISTSSTSSALASPASLSSPASQRGFGCCCSNSNGCCCNSSLLDLSSQELKKRCYSVGVVPSPDDDRSEMVERLLAKELRWDSVKSLRSTLRRLYPVGAASPLVPHHAAGCSGSTSAGTSRSSPQKASGADGEMFVVWTTRSSDPSVHAGGKNAEYHKNRPGGSKTQAVQVRAEKVEIVASLASRAAANRFAVECFCKGLPRQKRPATPAGASGKPAPEYACKLTKCATSECIFLRARFPHSQQCWGVGSCERGALVGDTDAHRFPPSPPVVPRLGSSDSFALPPGLLHQQTSLVHSMAPGAGHSSNASSPSPREMRCSARKTNNDTADTIQRGDLTCASTLRPRELFKDTP